MTRVPKGSDAAGQNGQHTPTRPVLRWHGGKWRLTGWMRPARRVFCSRPPNE